MNSLVAATISDTKTNKLNWHKLDRPIVRMKSKDQWCDKIITCCRMKTKTGFVNLKLSWLVEDSTGSQVPGSTKLEVLWRLSKKGNLALRESLCLIEKGGVSEELTQLSQLVNQKLQEHRIDQATPTSTEVVLNTYFEEDEE